MRLGWRPLLVAGLLALSAQANAFTPADTSPLWWYKADTGVFKDAGVTPAANNDTVQQWNDQSGNASDLSQATGGNRPTFKTSIIGSQPVVRCDGAASFMTGPNVFPTTTPWTMVVVAVQRGTSAGNLVSGNSEHALYYNSTNFVNVLVGGTIQLTATTSTGTGVTAFHMLSDVVRSNTTAANTSSNNLWVNGNYNSGMLDNNGNADAALELCGFNGASNLNNGDIAEAWAFAGVPTRATANNIIQYENARYGTTAPIYGQSYQLIFDGDSITAGLVGAPPFPMLTANHFGGYAVNLGSQGAYMADLVSQAATLVDPLFQAGVIGVDTVFAGTNDLALGGRTAAQVYTDFQTYCAARHAAGWKVAVIDMLPRSVGTEAARTTLNADFDADTCADAHVKTTCNTPMWAAGANSDPTWYDTPTDIHPNTNGHSIIAACLETAIAPLITAFSGSALGTVH